MKVTSITPNYNQWSKSSAKNNQPAFGNFIKLEVPYSMLPDSNPFFLKKAANSYLGVIKEIAEEINNITQGKVNVFRRTLEDMGFREKHANGVYEDFARTLFIEDNNGKTKSELLKASEYLIDKGINFETFSADLFAPKVKGFMETSNLDKVAYGAKPEQMIKL